MLQFLLIPQLFFKQRIQDEEGYILFVRKNALQVLIPKYGLEGTIFLNDPGKKTSSFFVYNEEVKCIFIRIECFVFLPIYLKIDGYLRS